jgi:hypothetical protein
MEGQAHFLSSVEQFLEISTAHTGGIRAMMADRRRTTEARIKPVRTVIYRLI